ncbi:MAG: hypothetical protein IKY22_10955 [Bacteroidales bacterium]|nr:hypothetical protein [Bacteroidales bacterium]MBR5778966.1 hypothetical protein [Bacteroidales bacterium]
MMDIKKQFKYNDDSLSFSMTLTELKTELKKKKQALLNLLELTDDLDDETFVSRANGYATTKWGKDVIEDKIEQYKKQINQLNIWINTFDDEQ